MRAVIYARYSIHNQREESIEDQVMACEAAARDAGDEVVAVFFDRAASGTTDRRPGFLGLNCSNRMHVFGTKKRATPKGRPKGTSTSPASTGTVLMSWKTERRFRDALRANSVMSYRHHHLTMRTYARILVIDSYAAGLNYASQSMLTYLVAPLQEV